MHNDHNTSDASETTCHTFFLFLIIISSCVLGRKQENRVGFLGMIFSAKKQFYSRAFQTASIADYNQLKQLSTSQASNTALLY